MSVIKFIIGILAVLFAMAHVVGLMVELGGGKTYADSSYAAGVIFGRVLGICIGALIARACFRPKKVG